MNTATVAMALDKMTELRISCVGAVDQTNRLTGSFSIDSLKGYGARLFHREVLDLTLAEFLRDKPAIHVESHIGFDGILENLVEKKTHHLWITRDDQPTDIVTLT